MIYICIPALNEARTVGVLLWRIRRVMEEFPRDYHVLVLDDGSTDDTPEVLAPYARVLPLTVLRNERTLGYAAALETLVREAVQRSTHPKRDAAIVLQADFTESPDDIPNFIRRLEGGADVVGSSVASADGELPRSLRWSRRGLPWLLSRSPLPKELGDPLSGFRAYRVAVLKRALQDRDGKPLLTRAGWAANAELLLSVAPYARRAEGVDVELRYTRRERETRFRAWGTVREVWDFVRAAPRRLKQVAAPTATSAASAPATSATAADSAPAARAQERPRAERVERPQGERARPPRQPRPPQESRPAQESRPPQEPPRPPREPKPPREPRPAEEPAAAAPAPPSVEGGEGAEAPRPRPRRRSRSRSRRGPRGGGEQPPTPDGE